MKNRVRMSFLATKFIIIVLSRPPPSATSLAASVVLEVIGDRTGAGAGVVLSGRVEQPSAWHGAVKSEV